MMHIHSSTSRLRGAFALAIVGVGVALTTRAVIAANDTPNPGSLVRCATNSTIYFVTQTKERSLFTDVATFRSWYPQIKDSRNRLVDQYSKVQVIPKTKCDQVFRDLPLIPKNITIRPGTSLVKTPYDPKIYAVTPEGLRWVESVDVLRALYPSTNTSKPDLVWQANLVILPEVFIQNYTHLETSITQASDFDRAAAARQVSTIDILLKTGSGTPAPAPVPPPTTPSPTPTPGPTPTPTPTPTPVGSAPQAWMTWPENNAMYTAPNAIELHANATDADGQITRVEFLVDGVVTGEDTTAPYSALWRNPPGGVHAVIARAIDNQNNQGSSASVQVTIGGGASIPTNPSPTPTPGPTPTPTPVPGPRPPVVIQPQPTPPAATGPLAVPLTVKEVAGVSMTAYPVQAVVPLPEGRFQNTTNLRVRNVLSGALVPAQFEVLNRHYAKDNSIRHVVVHFQADTTANGNSQFVLEEGSGNIVPTNRVQVTESSGAITVDTGTGGTALTITKQPFSIRTAQGNLVPVLHTQNGEIERSFDAGDITTTVEERGPMRSVIRISSPTRTLSPGRIRHGFAMRIYTYAGKPFVKVDYQLQNNARDVQFSSPMYFDSLILELATNQTGTTAQALRAENVDFNPQTRDPAPLVTPNTQVMIRRFYETWPNGLTVNQNGAIAVELFPAWSGRRVNNQMTSLGLHWLNDMQSVVKEVLFNFGPSNSEQSLRLARTFDFHPIVTLPTSWYRDTAVTLDTGGIIPAANTVAKTNLRKPDYTQYSHLKAQPPLSMLFGWDNFGANLYRKNAPSTAGDWPDSGSRFILSEDPADYYSAEDYAMGQLNVIPEWLSGYTYSADYSRLRPTENPYFGWSWRAFENGYGYDPVPGYLTGSAQEGKPRDDEHGWFYHVEEAYYASANPWIRDWYQFVGEFRKTRLNQQDPFPDMSSRAVGHALSNALQAYRVTGDTTLLKMVGDYLKTHVIPRTDIQLGGYTDRETEAMFQIGYLGHAIVTYLEELPGTDQQVFDLLGGFVRWNQTNAHWGYYTGLRTVNTVSDGTSMTFADPQAWYAVVTKNRALLDDIRRFMAGFGTGSVNGSRPYIALDSWGGDFNGRISAWAFEQLP